MGVVNLTIDSFFGESRAKAEKDILNKVENQLSEGADFIDLGAFSSRPGADLITEEEELERLIPAIKCIIKEFPKTILSIDTYRSSVAKKVIQLGASIINDISGGEYDDKMFKTAASLNAPYVMMHMQGAPKTMQKAPSYKDVFKEVYYSFSAKIERARMQGLKDIILDVGFGFGKTLNHNYTLLKKLEYFHHLNCPILVGLSRKSMIQKVIQQDASSALNGSTAAHVLALMNGANILRVHDVKAAKEAIQIVDFYQKQ